MIKMRKIFRRHNFRNITVNLYSVVCITGVLLLVLGLGLIPSLLVSFIYKEATAAFAFVCVILPCILIGLFFYKKFNPEKIKLKTRDGFIIVTLCWLLSSFVGAMPFVLSGAIPNFFDAFFESCSGFSTTGSTILNDIEALPKSILFWRSFTHWLGGMGVIVLIMAIFASIGIGGQVIASAETPGPTLDKLTPKFTDTAKGLYKLYLGLTIVQTILLLIGGMNLYDSLLHTFGTIGTGGFSSYGDSIAHFESPYIRWVIIIFMLIAGTNFNLIYSLRKNGPKSLYKDPEFKFYITLVGVVALLITADLVLTGTYDSPIKAFNDSVFQVASITTTTGYATADFDVWPTFCRMLIFMLLLTGGCSSSTSGGVKMIRIIMCIKLIKRGISLKIHPNRVVPIRIGKQQISQEVATAIANFVFFYLFVLFSASVLLSFNGYDLVSTVSSVMTCLGNVGPGFNLVGPVMNFSFYSNPAKLLLSLLMIAGRLELFTFFIIFSPHYWNSNRA